MNTQSKALKIIVPAMLVVAGGTFAISKRTPRKSVGRAVASVAPCVDFSAEAKPLLKLSIDPNVRARLDAIQARIEAKCPGANSKWIANQSRFRALLATIRLSAEYQLGTDALYRSQRALRERKTDLAHVSSNIQNQILPAYVKALDDYKFWSAKGAAKGLKLARYERRKASLEQAVVKSETLICRRDLASLSKAYLRQLGRGTGTSASRSQSLALLQKEVPRHLKALAQRQRQTNRLIPTFTAQSDRELAGMEQLFIVLSIANRETEFDERYQKFLGSTGFAGGLSLPEKWLVQEYAGNMRTSTRSPAVASRQMLARYRDFSRLRLEVIAEFRNAQLHRDQREWQRARAHWARMDKCPFRKSMLAEANKLRVLLRG